ncbi:fimbrial protein [Siccibacter colletis]|uniref:fimbrial protein n=1 Tax=Siccibacter colletis TaxID=1505757 RepID=UPI0004E1E3A0|nr:fimbrial protein [Siccibacter colletis]
MSSIRRACLLQSIFFVSAIFLSLNAHAGTCEAKAGPWNIDFGEVIIQRDVAIGSALSTKIYGEEKTAYTCHADNQKALIGMREYLTHSELTSEGGIVYKTNLPGLGILVGGNGEGYESWLLYSPIAVSGPGWIMFNGWYPVGQFDLHLKPYVKFIKIGEIASGNVSGQVAYAAAALINMTTNAVDSWGADIPINLSGKFTVLACSLTTSALNFNIGDIPANTFGSTIGATPVSTENTQNLGLNCDADANINVSLSGTQNPDVNVSSVLAPTGYGDAGVADGIGIQLIYNDVPLELNKNIVLKKSAGGQETFPLTARYYQTKTTVMPGKANASATLNITYQ